MKLAEALILRADYKKRIEQLKARLLRNARVQEGDGPAENPLELLDELNHVASELNDLIKRINRANSTTEFASGLSISDVLAERDVLVMRRGVYAELASNAATRQDRYMRTEIKYVSTVDIAAMQKQADELSKAYREMDSRIQELNWKTELSD
jgi:hypothetical protein